MNELVIEHDRGVVRVRHGGRLLAESATGFAPEGRDDLAEKVRGAYAAENLYGICRSLVSEALKAESGAGWEDHVNTTPKAKREAYQRGLFDGLAGKVTHYAPPCPPDAPEGSPSYRRGYDAGDAIVRAVGVAGRLFG